MNESERQRRELLVPALRVARMNMRLVADDIDAMGIMLRSGGITIQEAIEWLDRLGVTGYVGEISLRLLSADDDEAEIPSEEEAA